MRACRIRRDTRAPQAMLKDVCCRRSMPRTSMRLADVGADNQQYKSGNQHRDLQPMLILFPHTE